MGKTYPAAMSAVIAAAVIGTPLLAKVNSLDGQIGVEQQHSHTLQVDLKASKTELTNAKAYAADVENRLKLQADDLNRLRAQVAQLQKDLDAAKAQAAAAVKQSKAVAAVAKSAPTKVRVTSSGKSGNCESYRSLVAAYFPAGQVSNALVAMRRESGCNPNAVSPSGDYGLMQIHFAAHSKKVDGNVKALFDPATNVKVAAEVYGESGGWGPWTTMQ